MVDFRSLFVFLLGITFAVEDCPCPDKSLCQPLQTGSRHEKVAFMVSKDNWRAYDYNQITTLVICTDGFDPQLVCLAHSRQVRLVWLANYDVKQLGNATARTEWVRTQVNKVKSTFTDGINFDMEDDIPDRSITADQYTQLVQELTNLIHVEVSGSMVKRHKLCSR